MLMNYSKTLVAVLAPLGIVASMGWFATVQAGGAGERRAPITVTIAIEPDEDPPCINPTRGVIAVAILSTLTFHAVVVNPVTVGFGPREADPLWVAYKDVNHD